MSHLYGVSLPTILVAAKSTSRRVCGSEMESVSSPDSLTLALTEVNGKAGKQRIYSRLGRKVIGLKTISADGSLIHTRETILCPSTPFKTDGRTLDPVCSHPTDPNRVSDCLLCWHLRQSALAKLKAAGEPSFPRLPTRIGYVKDGPGGNFFSTTPGQVRSTTNLLSFNKVLDG